MTNIPPKTSEAATTPQPSTSETPLAIPDPTNKVEIPATPAAATGPETLDQLAAQIREAHAAVCLAIVDALAKAKVAGDLLLKAKPQVGHNNFQTWIKEKCKFSYSSASVYMRVAKNWAKIEAEAKKQPTALLNLEQANEMTIKKKRMAVKVTTTTPTPGAKAIGGKRPAPAPRGPAGRGPLPPFNFQGPNGGIIPPMPPFAFQVWPNGAPGAIRPAGAPAGGNIGNIVQPDAGLLAPMQPNIEPRILRWSPTVPTPQQDQPNYKIMDTPSRASILMQQMRTDATEKGLDEQKKGNTYLDKMEQHLSTLARNQPQRVSIG